MFTTDNKYNSTTFDSSYCLVTIYIPFEINIQEIAIVVDPYLSGTLYTTEFTKYRVLYIVIQSSLLLLVYFVPDLDRSKFIEILPLSLSKELVLYLYSRNVVAVVAGCNTGVILTNNLAKRLNLPGNNPLKSAIRYYKDQIHKALKLCSL